MKIWINQFYMKNTKKILKKMINNYLNLNSNQKMKQAQMEVSEENNMSWHGFLSQGAVRHESWMRL